MVHKRVITLRTDLRPPINPSFTTYLSIIPRQFYYVANPALFRDFLLRRPAIAPSARRARAIASEDSVTSEVVRKGLKSNARWVNKLPINIFPSEPNPRLPLTPLPRREPRYCDEETDETCETGSTERDRCSLISFGIE